MLFEIQLFAAIILDYCFGDPRWFPHPVKLIGSFATVTEKYSRSIFGNKLLAGAISTIVIVGITGYLTWVVLFIASAISAILAAGVAVFSLYLSIAVKDLLVHSRLVYTRLLEGDLDQAREAVSLMVGRETSTLSEGEVTKACIESVAENMVDGITAPLFWAVAATLFTGLTGLGEICSAAVGAMVYKSVNTLDSMFGYRNERYILFGRFTAKLDDLVNWPVSRLSGVCLIASSFVVGLDWKQAFQVFIRDRLKHASPNGGHPESAVAGALGIRLGGSSRYHGHKVYKPTIGDVTRRVRPKDIHLTNRMVVTGSLVFLVIILLIRQAILVLIR